MLKEKRKPFTHEEDREIHVVQTFDSFTYWNLDSKPSCNDTMHTVMHWPKMSKAVSQVRLSVIQRNVEDALGTPHSHLIVGEK